jgi:hypothetical protein
LSRTARSSLSNWIKTKDDQGSPALHHSSATATSRPSEIGRTSISGVLFWFFFAQAKKNSISVGETKERRTKQHKQKRTYFIWRNYSPTCLHWFCAKTGETALIHLAGQYKKTPCLTSEDAAWKKRK